MPSGSPEASIHGAKAPKTWTLPGAEDQTAQSFPYAEDTRRASTRGGKRRRTMQADSLCPHGLFPDRRELTTHERMTTESREFRARGSTRRFPVPRHRRRGRFQVPQIRPRSFICMRTVSAGQAHFFRQSAGRKLAIRCTRLWPPGEGSVPIKKFHNQLSMGNRQPKLIRRSGRHGSLLA